MVSDVIILSSGILETVHDFPENVSLLIAPEKHRPAAALLIPTGRPYVPTLSPDPLPEDSQPITLDQCLAPLPIPGAHLASWGVSILTYGTSK